MDPTSTLADRAPDACTLPTAARGLRIAELDDLFRTSAIGVTRIGPRRARNPEPDVPVTRGLGRARSSRGPG